MPQKECTGSFLFVCCLVFETHLWNTVKTEKVTKSPSDYTFFALRCIIIGNNYVFLQRNPQGEQDILLINFPLKLAP